MIVVLTQEGFSRVNAVARVLIQINICLEKGHRLGHDKSEN